MEFIPDQTKQCSYTITKIVKKMAVLSPFLILLLLIAGAEKSFAQCCNNCGGNGASNGQMGSQNDGGVGQWKSFKVPKPGEQCTKENCFNGIRYCTNGDLAYVRDTGEKSCSQKGFYAVIKQCYCLTSNGTTVNGDGGPCVCRFIPDPNK